MTHRRKHSRRYRWLLPLRPFGLFLECPLFHRGGIVPAPSRESLFVATGCEWCR